MINRLFSLPKFCITDIEHNNGIAIIFASIKSKQSQCPVCGGFSSSVHDYYTRKIQDLSVFQNSTIILLKTRKFKCNNPTCNRKVFSEQTSHLLRYSRRTVRASKILDTLSIEVTGKLGSILSKQLLLPVSTSTVTRIALRQPIPAIIQPKVLGVDDWAFRKGKSYGTILIDMETSKPIDLLPSRESLDLKDWLRKYPDIDIVTRDRASAYSSAVNEVCPDTVQIADRFHLLMNLSDALDKYFKSVRPEISSLIKSKTDEIIKLSSDIVPSKEKAGDGEHLTANTGLGTIKLDQRIEIFEKVKELQADEVSIKGISRVLGISRNTVRLYFIQKTLSPKTSSKSTNIEIFTKYIVGRLNTNGYKIKDIIEEIIVLGYNGGRTQAYCNIHTIKSEYKNTAMDFNDIQKNPIHYVKPLSSRSLAKYIGVCINDITDPNERTYMETIIENIPEIGIVRRLVRLFKNMISSGCGNVKRWIEFIMNSKHKLPGLKTFANGISRDLKAVENGIRLPWSNGAVEGHVNRLKSIKRQMYGRAGFELLRRKVILSQTG